MKRLIAMLAAVLLLTGCAGRVDLMPDASPETSALALYTCDGQTVTRQFLFETEKIRDGVLKDFRRAKAEPAEVDVTTLQPPYYGLEIGSTEEGSTCGLWADGYFLTGSGAAYRLDYDFERLLADYNWEEPDTFQSLAVMPCASSVARTENSWNRNFLTAAQEPQQPEGITLELLEQGEHSLIVRFTNGTQEEWDYGYAFCLQVNLDGQWYEIPAERELSFIEVAVILPAGVETTETYDFSAYGALLAGTYRLVTESGLWTEFSVA